MGLVARVLADLPTAERREHNDRLTIIICRRSGFKGTTST